MILVAFTDVIGRFHPALVHLPIGILLLAVIMQWIPGKERAMALQPAISFTYLAGTIAAVLSCLSGWLLAAGGEYDVDTLLYHRWMGISVAVISAVGYYFTRKENNPLLKWLSLLLFALIMITGHLGGTLTHGEGYLTKGWAGEKDSAVVIKAIPNAQEAVVYADIIQPVLQLKCYSCHAAAKQKGGLRLDSREFILKGGKEGVVVKAGNPEASELYKRVILDPLDEKHMAPKGKPQMSEQDRVLLHWWIASGLNFTAKAKEFAQPAAIKTILTSLEQKVILKTSDVPAAPVEKASDTTLAALHKMGVTVLPISVSSNYLTANLVNVKVFTPAMARSLLSIKDQLIWLKMPGIQLANSAWKQIGELSRLVKLSIEHSNVSDEGLAAIASLTQLQYLNLVDTKITINGLIKLKGLKQLNSLYLGQTGLSKENMSMLRNDLPKTMIDTGGYKVISLPTDTQLLKSPPIKK